MSGFANNYTHFLSRDTEEVVAWRGDRIERAYIGETTARFEFYGGMLVVISAGERGAIVAEVGRIGEPNSMTRLVRRG